MKIFFSLVLSLGLGSITFADTGCPLLADAYLQSGISIHNDLLAGKGNLLATCHPFKKTSYPQTLCVYVGQAGGQLFLGFHSAELPPTDGVLIIYSNGFAPTNMTLVKTDSALIGQKFSVGGDSGATTHGKDIIRYDLESNIFTTRSYSKTGFFSKWTENTQLARDYTCGVASAAP
jgi:hypothetical protein